MKQGQKYSQIEASLDCFHAKTLSATQYKAVISVPEGEENNIPLKKRMLLLHAIESGAIPKTDDEKVQSGVYEDHHISKLDLSAADLREIELSGLDLSGSDFQYARLNKAVIKSCRLNGCDFFQAALDKATIKDADMVNADLTNISLLHARIEESLLQKANLACCDFDSAHFHKVDFTDADLSHTFGDSSWFIDCDLIRTNFDCASLPKAHFKHSEIGGANFGYADLTAADFNRASGMPQTLEHAILNDAHFMRSQIPMLGGDRIKEAQFSNFGKRKFAIARFFA